MFTSGSTGRPKGVAITHRGVLGLVVDTNYVTVSTTDRVAMTSGVSSDLITFEIWGPLLNGASVHIVDRDVLLSPREFARHLSVHGVTVMSVAAAVVNHGAYLEPLAEVPTLRTLHFGGEAGSPASARALLEAGLRASLLHTYGPTETTMLATFARLTEVRPDRIRLPIGYPVSATEVYVMDEWLRPLPPGMPGEICVAGDRLARGYLGRPALTAERFCPNPVPGRAGQLMYRTGDLGRLLADGQLEVLGRSDRQVKIRGFRVEPAEVEQALVDAPQVAQATVVARADEGPLRLIGYVTAMPGERVSVHKLREELSRRLPGYLVPSALVVLPELPLTASGKVDQRALPPPPDESSLAGARLHHPLDPRERTVASAMAELLGLPAVGRDDNFFALGGHSLLAVQLVDVLHRRGLDVPMVRLLAHPTVAGLARVDGPIATEQPVLVLVHGGGGGVGAYVSLLAEVRDRYRCVLVEAREARGLSVTALAAGYVEQVRAELSGPVAAFAGWSVGGLVALEMARQWQRESGTRAPVLMVDTWPGAPPEAGRGNALASFVYDLATSAGVRPPALPDGEADPGRALAAVLDELRPLPGFGRLDVDQLVERFALFRALSEAVTAHRPHPYDGPVTLVEAAGSPSKETLWAPLCPALRATTLPGDHYTVLRESAPALADIGAALLARPDVP
ncbi:AMP-binding protein [Phytohabitans houttuyneae]|nr:AMP-binding protein [Phytohabitans houttuyneae]